MTSYHDEQKERLATLLNDQRVRKDTMQSRAAAEANEIRGRFAQINKATVIGTEAAAQYPKLPEGSWSNQSAGVPPEELIDATDCGATYGVVLGEPHEQPEASLSALQAFPPAHDAEGGDDDAVGSSSPTFSDGSDPKTDAGAGRGGLVFPPAAAPTTTFRKRKI